MHPESWVGAAYEEVQKGAAILVTHFFFISRSFLETLSDLYRVRNLFLFLCILQIIVESKMSIFLDGLKGI